MKFNRFWAIALAAMAVVFDSHHGQARAQGPGAAPGGALDRTVLPIFAEPARLGRHLPPDLHQCAAAPVECRSAELTNPRTDNLDFSFDFSLGTVAELLDDVSSAGDAASAPAGASDSAELAKKLSNPLAALISVPFQMNYDEGFGPKDAGKWTLNIQPVIPFSFNEDWNIISRTILPVVYQESLATGIDSEFGLGDTVQSLFFSPKDPVNGWIIGAGPVFLLPTATDTLLGSENFGMGPTIVALQQKKGWTYGVLANHIWGVYADDDRDHVNATFVQPFLSHTWPSATTLALNTEATYDWDAREWNIPINLMLSQVIKIGNQPISIQAGPRWYPESPDGGAEWGFRFNITLMFPR
jgi:hypothetical protein